MRGQWGNAKTTTGRRQDDSWEGTVTPAGQTIAEKISRSKENPEIEFSFLYFNQPSAVFQHQTEKNDITRSMTTIRTNQLEDDTRELNSGRKLIGFQSSCFSLSPVDDEQLAYRYPLNLLYNLIERYHKNFGKWTFWKRGNYRKFYVMILKILLAIGVQQDKKPVFLVLLLCSHFRSALMIYLLFWCLYRRTKHWDNANSSNDEMETVEGTN